MKNTNHATSQNKNFISSLVFFITAIFGAIYSQSVIFAWQIDLHSPMNQTKTLLLLLSVVIGSIIQFLTHSWTIKRRIILIFSLSSFTFIEKGFQENLHLSFICWILFFIFGLSAGSEIITLFPIKRYHSFKLGWFIFALLSIIIPTITVPYFGTSLAFNLFSLNALFWFWQSFKQQNSPLFSPIIAFLFTFIPAISFSFWLTTQRPFLSTPQYLPIEEKMMTNQHFQIEKHKTLGIILVRGEGREFFSTETARWSEPLTHPLISLFKKPIKILLLGGEKGFILKELLHYPSIMDIDLMTPHSQQLQFFSTQPLLRTLHNDSFKDKRVHLFTFQDKSSFRKALFQRKKKYHAIIQALEPSWFAGDLFYNISHFQQLNHLLKKDGFMSIFWGIQTSSYVCMLQSMRKAHFFIVPYRSFGQDITWTFALASKKKPIEIRKIKLSEGHRYISNKILPKLFHFPLDQRPFAHSNFCKTTMKKNLENRDNK